MHVHENSLFDLDLGVDLILYTSTLYIMWPNQMQSLKLLRLTVKDEMHLQKNTLSLDLGVTLNVASALFFMWPNQVHSLKLLRLTV